MIVIGTNNGRGWLSNSLKVLEGLKVEETIVIVDTGSNERDALEFHQSLTKGIYDLDIQIESTPYKGYDSGAWIWAIANKEAEYYHFIQDSIVVNTKQYFRKAERILDEGKVASLLHFNPNQYDSFEQYLWVLEGFGTSEYKSGVFGPNFRINRDMRDKLNRLAIPIPTNKLEQMGMERGWGVLFNTMGFQIEAIEGDYNWDRLVNDDYELFTKRFGGRR